TYQSHCCIFCFAATSESSSAFELLILHTDEAQEWAAYLQQILKSSKHFHRGSVLLYAVSSADQLHGYNFEDFQRCKCIVVIFTGVFLDILCDPELHGAVQRLLYPPHKVVALLCGVSEDYVSTECFVDWLSWRKIFADDEPDQETLFIIFKSRVAYGSALEVEFSPENAASKRVLASVENECTISVSAPVTSLTLHADGSQVTLSPVTYYTSMGEVSRYLSKAADPVNFICQDVLLRLTAKPHASEVQVNSQHPKTEINETNIRNNFDEIEEEEEDPYNISPEDIYDTVDTNCTYNPALLNRPPAPIPRPEADAELEKPVTYISRGLYCIVLFAQLFKATFLNKS
ncbi:hypothetical protein XENOCAPTIV_004667, partial [Xenoophorus captivus]